MVTLIFLVLDDMLIRQTYSPARGGLYLGLLLFGQFFLSSELLAISAAVLVVAVVMAVLAIPFALTMGRRGSLTGIAVAIGVALTYFVIDNLFGALGNVNYLPAALAAWSSDILFGLVGGYLLLRTPT